MHKAEYYREQSARALRLAGQTIGEIHDTLNRVARDFAEIAEDLEKDAVEIRHPEIMPQRGGD